MDFFAQQDQARRKTKLLVVYFALAVVGIITMVYFAAWVFSASGDRATTAIIDDRRCSRSLWDPQVFLASTLGTLAVIFFGSAYKTMALAGGGSTVAESLGGRLVNPNTTEPDERKLLNVVEEMSIAVRRAHAAKSMCWTTRTASTPSPPATHPATPPSPSRATA